MTNCIQKYCPVEVIPEKCKVFFMRGFSDGDFCEQWNSECPAVCGANTGSVSQVKYSQFSI